MRKILSIILVLCMLFTSCIAMASCDLFGGSGSSETTQGDSDNTTVPGEDNTTIPGEDNTTIPGEDNTTIPGEDNTTVPGEDNTTVPGEDNTTVPGEDNTTVPDEDNSTVPGGDNEGDENVPGGDNGDDNTSGGETLMKDNVLQLISEGLNKSLFSFFDVANVSGTLCGMEKGALRITVDNSMLFEEYGIGRIMETLSFDMTGGIFNKLASDTSIVLGEDTLEASIYMDKENIGVLGEIILGTDGAYKLNVANIVDNFMNSELKTELEAAYPENTEMLIASLQMFEEVWTTVTTTPLVNEEFNAEMAAFAEELMLKLDPVAKTETVNDVPVWTVVYTISNETVASYLKSFASEAPESYYEFVFAMNALLGAEIPDVEAVKEMMTESYETLTAQIDANCKFNVLLSFSLSEEDGSLVDVSLVGNLDDEDMSYGYTIDPSVSIRFSGDAITLDVTVEYAADGFTETATVHFATTRTEEEGFVTYQSDLDVHLVDLDGEEVAKDDLIMILATYNKENGALAVQGAINVEYTITDTETGESVTDEKTITASFGGALIVKDGKVTFAVDSVAADGYALSDIGVTIEIDTTAEVPAIPADATEIMDQTIEEWGALFEAVMNSPLGQLISAMQPQVQPLLDGCYVSDNSDMYIFEEDMFEYFGANDEYLWGYYYIEDDGTTLVLEYWNDSVEDWQYNHLDLVDKGEVLVIGDTPYYYDDSYFSGEFLMGTYVDESETVYYYFEDTGYFEHYTTDGFMMRGSYEIYSSVDEEGYEVNWLYLEGWTEEAEDPVCIDVVIELYGDMIVIDGIEYVYDEC